MRLLVEYGPLILGTLLAALGGAVTRSTLQRAWLRDFLARLLVEARAVVLEIEQTYVDKIKDGRADTSDGGAELTPAEARAAKTAAINKLRENLGAKGLRRLARVVGLVDVEAYLSTHVESAVRQVAIDEVAAASGNHPPVPPSTLATTRPLSPTRPTR